MTKGEAPPAVEGDTFISLFEGASDFAVQTCDVSTGSCMVEFSYTGPGNRSSAAWNHKVYLLRTPMVGWLTITAVHAQRLFKEIDGTGS